MNKTASQTVHDAVTASKLTFRPLDVHQSALRIAGLHGIAGDGVWLLEQALLMVGARAGISMKIGHDADEIKLGERKLAH